MTRSRMMARSNSAIAAMIKGPELCPLFWVILPSGLGPVESIENLLGFAGTVDG